MLCAQASRPPGSVALTQGSKTPLFEPANPIFDSSRATSGQVLPWATSSRPCSRWSYRDSSLRRISSCNARMMVSESATVSGFILPGNHRSSTYAITYDAVYNFDACSASSSALCNVRPRSSPSTISASVHTCQHVSCATSNDSHPCAAQDNRSAASRIRRRFNKLLPRLCAPYGVPGFISQEISADFSASSHRSSSPNTSDSQLNTQLSLVSSDLARSMHACARRKSRNDAQVTACEASQLACVLTSASGSSGCTSQLRRSSNNFH